MVFNGEGQQAPMSGDPNHPESFDSMVPRYVPITAFDMPVRPESSASNQSSSSGLASQVSYVSDDGGVALPPDSVVTNSGHGYSQQQFTANGTGATNAQVQAPMPVRGINMNNIVNGAAHANTADVFTGGPHTAAPSAYRVGPSFSAPQLAPAYQYGNGISNGLSNGLGNGNKNNRFYRNGIPRRSRDHRIHGLPQAIAGGFNNISAFVPDGSRYPPISYNTPQQYPVNRMLFSGPPNIQSFRASVPHEVQFPTPLSTFNIPADPFTAPARMRSAAMADYIRSGAMDDGQSLDPDARTPTTGSDRRRRRTNSVQFYTPTRSRRNGHGSTPSSSDQSSVMATPSRNMRSGGSYRTPITRSSAGSRNMRSGGSYRTPITQNPAGNLLHGQTLPPPAWLYEVCTQQPTLDQALTSLPLSNPYEYVPARGTGVVRFIGIPYGTLRSELIASLGPKARPVNMPQGSPYYAVHIVMERNTGKTGDGFVETSTPREAMNIVKWINRRGTDGSRTLKIGNREVIVQVATQEELMAALFPHAKTVKWTGFTPRLMEVDTLFYPGAMRGLGFTGFCGNEELAMLVKFAESPSRSPFVQRTPHRLYECIISTLHRLPWHTPRYITLIQRKKLYDTVRVCLQTLLVTLGSDERDRHVSLSTSLLQELVVAALSCVGFSEQQKAILVADLTSHGFSDFATSRGMNVYLGGSGMFSACWPFLSLSPKAAVNSELLKYYISLISKASEVEKDTSLYNMVAHLDVHSRPFGRFAVTYGGSHDMTNVDLEQIVRSELDAVARVLSIVLLGGCAGPLYELE